jgi:hypothetical protein
MRGLFNIVKEVGERLDEVGLLWWLHVLLVGVLLFVSARVMLPVVPDTPWLPRLRGWGIVAIAEAYALFAHHASHEPGVRLRTGAVGLAVTCHLAAVGTMAYHVP